ncbi:sugar phosphate isomerase/epimerase [Sphingobacterium sp. UT-1RO-CII-1]|uniref:sugar phosphate isomerase/epimerase family protein n=1 Tax=Sphingobacterium sp. UT-1RO-CII-1 TaxID=2995225 RepID=UPI00227D464A|nr:sugar phosphate isomerase/epimerase family protein [Sphingobacterium sp. UT-1RO-CII-1]MCY4778398.1 sugar phosphate isomerase/epimerase [Sphingobacterium sp. UT-1RO-CII-1]
MPRLAVFPKAFMKELCVTGEMTLNEWIDKASKLEVDGLEWYAGFLEMKDWRRWSGFRKKVNDLGLEIPMMCCSPDFTHPDRAFRASQVAKQKEWIDMTHALGGSYCRVLSGQRRPELSIADGVNLTVDSIYECLDYARTLDVTLILENHYKDDFWKFPEFAQKSAVFCQIVDQIDDPYFGVNYDPSNTFLAGEDPLDLLVRVKHRVKTMHASDRFLVNGTIEDLRRMEDNSEGYASVLRHGEIGKGLNDYDRIFSILKAVGFDSWISIEDGVEGMDQLERSVTFVNRKIKEYWL